MSRKVQVAFDFNAESSNEVTVKEGEIIDLIEVYDDGWARVSKNNGDSGLIPSDYFSELNNNSDEIPSNFGGNNETTSAVVIGGVEEPNFNDDEHVEERKDIVLPTKPKITPDLKDATNISQELLDTKEQELNSREQYVGIQEQYIKDGLDANGNRIRNKPNWPICCPFVYHSVFKGTKKGFPRVIAIQGYILWFILCVILFLNFGCSIAIVSIPPGYKTNTTALYQADSTNGLFELNEAFETKQLPTTPGVGIPDFFDKVRFVVSAFLQFLLVIPLHFWLCYWPLYKAMGSIKTARFIIFFIAYLLAIFFDIVSLTGFYDLGFTGAYQIYLFIPISSTQGSIACMVINCVMFALWFLMLIAHIVLYFEVLLLFRRENYYMQRLTQYIKQCCLQCCSSALKKAVQKPNSNANIEENGIVG